jgi:hypothetical protein
MKNFIQIIIVCLFITSCGDQEEVIYDPATGQTLAFFDSTTTTLEIEINDSNTATIEVGVSTISSSDRTLTISVDASSTATPAMYSFNSSVTILANEYYGTINFTGIDDGLTSEGATLTLNIDPIAGGVVSSQNHTINLIEICPVATTFGTGMYTLDFVSGGVGAAGFAPALGTGIAVELINGSGATERTFNVKCYPSFGFSNAPADFSFNLVCGTTISNGIVDGQVSGVGCGGSIAFGPAASPGTYTVGDDTNMTLIFAEDTAEICGSVATTTYTLTKI